MDCIITAGGLDKPDSPMYAYTQGKSKALLDMNGRTMLERVVDALQESRSIGRIVVVGIGSDLGMSFQRPVEHVPDQGSMVQNAIAGIRQICKSSTCPKPVLLCSADIPTITGQIVDEYIDACRPFDKGMYYNFVTKEVMEKRFPHSNRTFVRLKEVEIAGGDMSIIQSDLTEANEALWNSLTNARKHAWKLAKTVGFGTLIKFLFHRLDVAEIEQIAGRLLNHSAKIILSPHAEIAMDADKPNQIDMLRADFSA